MEKLGLIMTYTEGKKHRKLMSYLWHNLFTKIFFEAINYKLNYKILKKDKEWAVQLY